MGFSDRQSTLFGAKGYVYYSTFGDSEEPYNEKRLEGVINSLNRTFENQIQVNEITATLQAAAKFEYNKERSFINEILGGQFGENFVWDEKFIKNYIGFFSEVLRTKDLYERNRDRIKEGQAMIDVSNFVMDYFERIIKEKDSEIKQMITADKKIFGKEQAIENALNKYLPQYFEEAVKRALKSKDFNRENGKQTDVYLKLLQQIEDDINSNRQNPFIQALWRNHNIPGAISSYKEAMMKQEGNYERRKLVSKLKTNVRRLSGTDFEIWNLEIAKYALTNKINGLGKSGQVSFSAGRVGQSSSLADLVYGINIDVNLEGITEAYKKGAFKDRITRIQLIEEALDKIPNNEESFIIYESDKNYTLGRNFEENGGFSGGSGMSLKSLEYILSKVPGSGNVKLFLNTLMQFGEGRILEDTDPDEYLSQISQYIAYFLFDDVKTIGNTSGGAKGIHVFNLDGTIVPLSFFLQAIIQAFDKTWSSPDYLFQLQLTPAQVLYPRYSFNGQYTRDLWEAQAAHSMSNTIISVSFLRNFQDIVKEFL